MVCYSCILAGKTPLPAHQPTTLLLICVRLVDVGYLGGCVAGA
jgi:hypothetical protein